MNIKYFRDRLGITQEELAKAVGVTQGAVSQWEAGATHPSFKMLRTLARVLCTTVDAIIGESA